MSSARALDYLSKPCYIRPMPDRIFYTLMLLVTALLVATALVWPKGIGVAEPAVIYDWLSVQGIRP